jgi:CSLREA domain-containing protein
MKVMKTGLCALVLLALFSSPAFAVDFRVNSFLDLPDADPGDRVCATSSTLPDGTPICTLRAAIQEANWWERVAPVRRIHEPIVIHLATGEYRLTRALLAGQEDRTPGSVHARAGWGDLDIEADVQILGGAGLTVITGDGTDRVFDLSGGLRHHITLSRITIRDGWVLNEDGGCIRNEVSTLWMNDVTVEGCSANRGFGGGLDNDNGLAVLDRVRFRGTTALRGGARENCYGEIIERSTFDGNTATVSAGSILTARGGASSNLRRGFESSVLTVKTSTFVNNRAAGGAAVFNAGRADVVNSTISANTGSAILSQFTAGFSGPIEQTVRNSTVVNNEGEGVSHDFTLLELIESIVANNRDTLGTLINCGSPVTGSRESLEDGDSCELRGLGDLHDTDPMLAPLAYNGGYTNTHALLEGSPAIDAAGFPGDREDQRGVPRPVGAAGDIGAYEFGLNPAVLTATIAVHWREVFRSPLPALGASYTVNISLAGRSKPGESADASSMDSAHLTGVKAAAGQGQLKYEIDPSGTSLKVSGFVIPPKPGSGDPNDTLLFSVLVQRAIRGATIVGAEGESCACAAKPASATFVLAPIGSLKQQ